MKLKINHALTSVKNIDAKRNDVLDQVSDKIVVDSLHDIWELAKMPLVVSFLYLLAVVMFVQGTGYLNHDLVWNFSSPLSENIGVFMNGMKNQMVALVLPYTMWFTLVFLISLRSSVETKKKEIYRDYAITAALNFQLDVVVSYLNDNEDTELSPNSVGEIARSMKIYANEVDPDYAQTAERFMPIKLALSIFITENSKETTIPEVVK